MLPNYQNIIDTARTDSVQSHNRAPAATYGVNWLAKAGLFASGWWSEKRDKELRNFWKRSDHLSGAIYNMTSKMTAIPFQVVARDATNRKQVARAQELTETMRATAQFGEGWTAFFSRFVEDLITQDNGAFAEIIGPGALTGPLEGAPVSFAHLDSARCQRTGDPIFPVLYRDDDGKMYKLHYTRVMSASQMTSPIKEMNGVGFSAVSRCMSVAQTLIDILTFKQEKLGSRPHRAILITRGGLDPKDVADAFQMAENTMDSQGLSRYSKVVVAGSSAIEEASLEKHELSSLPEGFDERTSIELGMATIALALGMDARELFPGMTAGASRADALVQHLKQRGKGPGQIIEIVEQLFTNKYLPVDFSLSFDYQDDAQDRQVAEIRRIRAERTNMELINGILSKRTAREQMMQASEIDRGQFDLLEVMDGRLDDGTDVLNMFYRDVPPLAEYLDLGVEDPLDFAVNDAKACYLKSNENLLALRKEIEKMHKGARMYPFRTDAYRIVAALLRIKQIYLHIYQSGASSEIDKLIAADAALARLSSAPELGQKYLDAVSPPVADARDQANNLAEPAINRKPDSTDGKKPGPNPNTARAGAPLDRRDKVAPSGQEQMNPRDLVKPRSEDVRP